MQGAVITHVITTYPHPKNDSSACIVRGFFFQVCVVNTCVDMKFKESMFVYLAFLACVFVFYSRSIEHTIRYGKNLKLMRTVCKSLMAEADEGQRMYEECTAASTSSITPDEIGAVVLDHSNNIVLKRNCTFDDEDILNYMQNSEVPLRKLGCDPHTQ